MTMDCSKHPVLPPKTVAIAQDKYLKPKIPFPDPVNLAVVPIPKYGQDLTFGMGRKAPKGHDVGKTPKELKPKMQKLLSVFASGDKAGMAQRLFDAFLKKQSKVTYFDDAALNTAAANHSNIQYFCKAALAAPNSGTQSPGKVRIHQALKKAQWDIGKIIVPTDLGVPAFNKGSKLTSSGDFDNGLGLMINGVQYVYVVATHYHYDKKNGKYCMRLRFIFYDVFGLDDDDLDEFGATSDGFTSSTAGVGITAWWQLQHQHGYAPLVTRIIHEETYEVPAK